MIATILLIFAFAFALCAAANVRIGSLNVLGLSLACFFAAKLVPLI